MQSLLCKTNHDLLLLSSLFLCNKTPSIRPLLFMLHDHEDVGLSLRVAFLSLSRVARPLIELGQSSFGAGCSCSLQSTLSKDLCAKSRLMAFYFCGVLLQDALIFFNNLDYFAYIKFIQHFGFLN
jgi:hypothetical protein